MNKPETIENLPPRPEKPADEMAETVRKREAPPPPPNRLIEQADAAMREEIAAAQAETRKRLAGVDAAFGAAASRELADARRDALARLDANAAAMQAVADEAQREAAKFVAAADANRKLRNPKVKVDAALLVGLADLYPDKAVDGLIAKGKDFSYDDKLRVLLPALAADPDLGAKLDAAGLSPGEKFGVVLRLAKDSPFSFFRAAETSGLDFSLDEKKAIAQDMLERDPMLFPAAAENFRFSHDAIVDIIREYHPDDAAVLLKTLGIPGPEGAAPYADLRLSREETAWFMKSERNPEKRAAFKTVERAKGASRDLMLAIEAAYPDRVASERERFQAEQQLFRPIERVGELYLKKDGSANKPLYINLEGRILPACYKPKRRETMMRRGIAQGEMVGRELLAAFVDRALKMDLVPPTVLRDGPDGIGTVQDWKVGKTAYRLGEEAYADKHDEQLTRLAFFDWMTQNSDRHDSNWLVSPDGKHQAIDNGSIFGKRVDRHDGLRSFPSAAMAGRPLPPELRKNVEGLLGSPEVMAALKKGFEATLSAEDADRSWKEFVGRLERVISNPVFAIQPSEWSE